MNLKAPSCPACGARIDGTTGIGSTEAEDVPGPGDVTVCICCATVLTFGEQMELTPAVLSELPVDVREYVESVAGQLRRQRYQFCADALVDLVREWLKRYPERPLKFALPPRDIGIIGTVDQLGPRMVRSPGALMFLKGVEEAWHESPIRLDAPSIFMLQYALEANGVAIERVSLAELGLVESDKGRSS